MAAQANFVRVKVERLDGDGGSGSGGGEAPLPPPPRTRLLCVVRGLLKKMKKEVLVGDYVRVVGIDWTDGRGERGGCRWAGSVSEMLAASQGWNLRASSWQPGSSKQE